MLRSSLSFPLMRGLELTANSSSDMQGVRPKVLYSRGSHLVFLHKKLMIWIVCHRLFVLSMTWQSPPHGLSAVARRREANSQSSFGNFKILAPIEDESKKNVTLLQLIVRTSIPQKPTGTNADSICWKFGIFFVIPLQSTSVLFANGKPEVEIQIALGEHVHGPWSSCRKEAWRFTMIYLHKDWAIIWALTCCNMLWRITRHC